MTIELDENKPGEACPDCSAYGQAGKLYAYRAGCFIRLEGQPLVAGKRYQLAGARCHLCSKVFKPEVPSSIKDAPRFAPSAVSNIAIGHYTFGLPFNRIEQWQNNNGVPLPDSTQYDEMAKLAKKVLPIVKCLKQLSANSHLFYYDDTPLQVLQLKQSYGTAIVSQSGAYWIYLFCVSPFMAGKEVSNLLTERTNENSFITMSDALSHNQLSSLDETLLARVVIAYCLVHGRRKFYELLDDFPKACQFVIDCIADVYRHEAHCQRLNLSPSERLAYHQQHSAPVMSALKTYLTNLWQYDGVEHNGTLGKAVSYMLKRWSALTRFLTVEGCPIDNSLCERAIKDLIRYRKNSLFYRTIAGAHCGNTLMSLIHTAMKNGINAFHYLNALQDYVEFIPSNPEGFLPWHYEKTIAMMRQDQAA